MIVKRFNELLDFIGANKKIEIIKFSVINGVIVTSAVLATIFLKQIMVVFVALIAIIVANYLLINSYITKKKEILMDRERELITLIGYFQFFINNSYNVYQAFQSLIAYSSSWMAEQIQTLIQEIDNLLTLRISSQIK